MACPWVPLGPSGELSLAFEELVTPPDVPRGDEVDVVDGSDACADGAHGAEGPVEAEGAEGAEAMLAEAYVDVVCSLRLRSHSSVEVVVIVVGVVVLVRATDSEWWLLLGG